jgi:hypothetical protein
MTRDLQLAKRIRGDRFWSLIIVCCHFSLFLLITFVNPFKTNFTLWAKGSKIVWKFFSKKNRSW